MALGSHIRDAVIKQVKDINLNMLSFYARENQQILSYMRGKNIINDGEIEAALECAVLSQSARDYDNLICGVTSDPEHLLRPEVFAYGIMQNVFTRSMLKRIPFEEGDDLKSFVKRYSGQNILSGLRKELFNPLPAPNFAAGIHCISCG